MQFHPRQVRLIDEVRRLGSVSVDTLAERFGVTLQTVRRDARQLAEVGLLARFHGGVRVPGSTTENIAYRQRQRLNEAAKQRIAATVAAAVPHGCSLILNIGTTTEAIARELMLHRGLRVITNNLNVAAILSDHADCELIVAGGVVRARDRGIVGEATVDFIRQFKVDVALIGISGIESDGTLRDFDYREVRWRARSWTTRARSGWPPTTASSTARRWSNWHGWRTWTACTPTRHRPSPSRTCWPKPACNVSSPNDGRLKSSLRRRCVWPPRCGGSELQACRRLASPATCSPIASDAVSPGLSMPKSAITQFWLSSITKSPCGSPGPCSLGRMPA